jgi:ComF family protein
MAIVLPPATQLKRVALDMVFPRWCINCGKEGGCLCRDCRRNLSFIHPPVCPRCGRPLDAPITANICPGCAEWDGRIDGVRAPFIFEGLIRRAVHDFKYNNLKALDSELAALMYDYLKENPIPGDALVPVPLHDRRLRERGYNQSALLARELGKLTGLPVVEGCLSRRIYVSSQARSASIEERKRNVTDAFNCRDRRLKDKNVILIDDVSTSGATLNACAGVLKAAGATGVRGLVIALEL